MCTWVPGRPDLSPQRGSCPHRGLWGREDVTEMQIPEQPEAGWLPPTTLTAWAGPYRWLRLF